MRYEEEAAERRRSRAWAPSTEATLAMQNAITRAVEKEREACRQIAHEEAKKMQSAADAAEPDDRYFGPLRNANRAVAALWDACADACYRIEGAIRSRMK